MAAKERRSGIVQQEQLRLFKDTSIMILASTNTAILRETISGNLAKAEIINPEVRKALALLQQYAREPRDRPCIYRQLLVNQAGESSMPEELLEIVETTPSRAVCRVSVFQPEIASVAEILITWLSHGYVSSGRDFSFYFAGRSNFSAYKIPHEQRQEVANYAMENTAHRRNFQTANEGYDAEIGALQQASTDLDEQLRECERVRELLDGN